MPFFLNFKVLNRVSQNYHFSNSIHPLELIRHFSNSFYRNILYSSRFIFVTRLLSRLNTDNLEAIIETIDKGLLKVLNSQIKEWGPRLRKAVSTASEINPDVFSMFVLHQKNGHPFAVASFDQRWRKAIIKAREETQLPLDFAFHDIKAKGISNFEGTVSEKQQASGHKTESQVRVYDRKVAVVPTVESKK